MQGDIDGGLSDENDASSTTYGRDGRPMSAPPYVMDQARVTALRDLAILDTPPEPVFDCVTRIASDVFGVPIALVSLVDVDRQWFKSCLGLDDRETDLDHSFCVRAILSDEPLVVRDARDDPAFRDHPAVVGDPFVRFYAGIPLSSSDGHRLGTLCVIDRVPRELTPTQLSMLRDLAATVETLIQLRSAAIDLGQQSQRLRSLATIVESSQDAIITKTLDGVVTSWNDAAESLYGYRCEEALGRSIEELIAPEDENDVPQILARLRRGERIDHYETRRRRKDGTIIDVSLTVSPLRDEKGEMTGASVIARDITERKRMLQALEHQAEALRIAKQDAEQANAAKTEFLSRMSHEFRTPLNAILGFAQLLELDDLTDDQRDSTKQIIRGGRRLLELINEVLDIARVESGDLTISLEPVALLETARASADLIRPLAEERGISLAIDSSVDDCCHVFADRLRLDQVLLNLLSNAVKYNVEGGNVSVIVPAQKDEDVVRLAVRDTGPGIAPEDVPRLFTPFDRLDAEYTEVEGTGLGLALTRRLVEAMGGRIAVESQRGKGATFWVELPSSEPPVDLDTLPAPRVTERSKTTERRLLYIEDNVSNRLLLERLLAAKRPGVKLIAAMTGDLGLDLARQHIPDIILLDLHLPDLDGEEVLARLRRDPRTTGIPVVILSADAAPTRVERLRAAGADDYLTKPLDVDRLLSLLDDLLGDDEEASA